MQRTDSKQSRSRSTLDGWVMGTVFAVYLLYYKRVTFSLKSTSWRAFWPIYAAILYESACDFLANPQN